MKNTIRSAFSLLEVTIASMIFVVVVAVAIEFLGGFRTWSDTTLSHLSLEQEAHHILKEMINDLGNSAWYLPDETSGTAMQTENDRDLRYYPYIIKQTDTAIGEAFSAHNRLSKHKATVIRKHLMAQEIPIAHILPSQEVIFVKIAKNTPTETPSLQNTGHVDFSVPAIPLDNFADAPITKRMLLDLSGTDPSADMRWERHPDGRLREYSFSVVFNPETHDRELQCLYFDRNESSGTGSGTPIIYKTLSSLVDRIKIDTCRTLPGLAVDQIRIELFLSKQNTSGPPKTYRTAVTVAMRSTVDPGFSNAIDDWVGNSGTHSLQ